MGKEFSIKLVSGKQAERMFNLLPEKVARKPVRKATNAASQIVLKEFKKNLPKDTGSLKKSAAKKVITSKDKTLIAGLIGADRKKEFEGKSGGRILHLIERGYIRKDGVFVPGQFPLARAKASTTTKRKAIFGKKMGEEITKEAIKLGYHR